MTLIELPDAEYRAVKALSYSGAKLLLPPSCPARFKWDMDHGRPSKPVFDFGHAAHKAVLGVGQPVRYIQADTWATKAAKEQRAEAYEAGEIPLLAKDEGVIEGMVTALRAHPIASRLLAPGTGQAEASIFWKHEDTGVDMRARLDWLPQPRRGRMLVPDYKTADSADPQGFARSAANYGYAMQDAFYSAAVESLGHTDPGFLFVVQEKAAPYLVNVIELDFDAKRIGRALMDRAARIYRECTTTDTWPSYSTDVDLISLPVWWQRENDLETTA